MSLTKTLSRTRSLYRPDLKMVDGAMPPHDAEAGGVVDAPATSDVGIDFRAKGRVSHKIRYRSTSRMHGTLLAHTCKREIELACGHTHSPFALKTLDKRTNTV